MAGSQASPASFFKAQVHPLAMRGCRAERISSQKGNYLAKSEKSGNRTKNF